MDTESVSEVTGPHDMEAVEKKNHNFFIHSTIKRAVSHSSSLLIESAAGLESLGHMTWKILKKLQLFCIHIFLLSNLMMVPKSVVRDSVQLRESLLPCAICLFLSTSVWSPNLWRFEKSCCVYPHYTQQAVIPDVLNYNRELFETTEILMNNATSVALYLLSLPMCYSNLNTFFGNE